jgi:hypothetical protein
MKNSNDTIGNRTRNLLACSVHKVVHRLYTPSRRCLHFAVVGGLEWSNDPERYAGGSVATGRVSLAGQVEGDDPD